MGRRDKSKDMNKLENVFESLHQLPSEIQEIRDEIAEIQLEASERINKCQEKMTNLFSKVYQALDTVQGIKRRKDAREQKSAQYREEKKNEVQTSSKSDNTGQAAGREEQRVPAENQNSKPQKRPLSPSPSSQSVKTAKLDVPNGMEEMNMEQSSLEAQNLKGQENMDASDRLPKSDAFEKEEETEVLEPTPSLPTSSQKSSPKKVEKSDTTSGGNDGAQNIEQDKDNVDKNDGENKDNPEPNTSCPASGASDPLNQNEEVTGDCDDKEDDDDEETLPVKQTPTLAKRTRQLADVLPKIADPNNPNVFHGTAKKVVRKGKGKGKTYTCFCGKERWWTLGGFANHYFERTSGKKYRCNRCNTGFLTCSSLKDHTIQKHKVNIFTCGICVTEFDSKQEYDLHIQAEPATTKCGKLIAKNIAEKKPYKYLLM